MIILDNKIKGFRPSYDVAYFPYKGVSYSNISLNEFRLYYNNSVICKLIPEDLIIAKLNTYNLEKPKWANVPYVALLYEFVYNKSLPTNYNWKKR